MDQALAEEATGIRQTGNLRIFHHSDEDKLIYPVQAAELLAKGETIEIPAAGAGSYHEVIRMLGLELDHEECLSSSAGDWQFRLKDGSLLCQTSRHPCHGFAYSLGEH